MSDIWARELEAALDNPDGAELLDDLVTTLTRFVIFPDEHSTAAVALWIAATHALPWFDCAPRLVITSPEKRCGKTRLLDIIVVPAITRSPPATPRLRRFSAPSLRSTKIRGTRSPSRRRRH